MQPILPRPCTPPDIIPVTIPLPDTPRPISKIHAIYAFYISSIVQIFINQTERMPIRYKSDNSDLLIQYNYGINLIHAEPMPSYTGYQIILTYQHAHVLLTSKRTQAKIVENRQRSVLIPHPFHGNQRYQLPPCPPACPPSKYDRTGNLYL